MTQINTNKHRLYLLTASLFMFSNLQGTEQIDIQAVQESVAKSVVNTSANMCKALLDAQQEKLNFKQLAQKHTNPNLQKELSQSDEKVQRVYRKLFAATHEHIYSQDEQVKKVCQPLAQTLVMVKAQGENEQNFLGSFVFAEAKKLTNQLQEQQPAALENKSIWE